MRFFAFSFGSILLLFSPSSASAQAFQSVTLCQLEEHADDFDHKLVTVRATTNFQFEDFTLGDGECQSKNNSVWLTFGGDVSDIATYCCGDHSRQKGHILRIDGRPISLVKDASYERFVQLLHASRNRIPDGEQCYEGCSFYRVTATLSGLFLRKTAEEGYGHLGCCNLLIIQKVTDVSAVRTSVPIGGVFRCGTESWKTRAAELPGLDTLNACKSDCDRYMSLVITDAAAHWNQRLRISDGEMTKNEDSTVQPSKDVLTWVSHDLLSKYTIVQEHSDEAQVSVTRQSCEVTQPPLPDSAVINCDEHALSYEWDSAKQRKYGELIDHEQFVAAEGMIVQAAEKLSAQGNQSWRTSPASTAATFLVARQNQAWKIKVDSSLQSDQCGAPQSTDEQKYAYTDCTSYSPDGMQEFRVTLIKRKVSDERTQWLLGTVSARVCHLVSN